MAITRWLLNILVHRFLTKCLVTAVSSAASSASVRLCSSRYPKFRSFPPNCYPIFSRICLLLVEARLQRLFRWKFSVHAYQFRLRSRGSKLTPETLLVGDESRKLEPDELNTKGFLHFTHQQIPATYPHLPQHGAYESMSRLVSWSNSPCSHESFFFFAATYLSSATTSRSSTLKIQRHCPDFFS